MFDWENYTPPVPKFIGTRGGQNARATGGPGILPGANNDQTLSSVMDLRGLCAYIDWTPFFHAWELRGVWDRENKVLLTKNEGGAAEAAKLYQDALAWIDRIISEDRFQARGICGFFPANAECDDIIVWADESRSTERTRFHTLRQQLKKDSGKPNVALADWVAPCGGDHRSPHFEPTFLRTDEAITKQDANRLPHWFQDGATYAVTFRLTDSLPASVIRAYQREKTQLGEKIRKALDSGDTTQANHLQRELENSYQLCTEKVLHAGHGACWMKSPEIARVVRDALFHFDGDHYQIGAWCVMSNHVHLIIRPGNGHSLSEVMRGIKSASAREANRLLGRTGAFWQKEFYDHMIRDEDDYRNQRSYILKNPESAGLVDWAFVGEGQSATRRPVIAATDHLGAFVVGIHGADEYAAELENAHDPYGAIMVKALADRFAEAAAELLHHWARVEWGYETAGEFAFGQLIDEKYRGIRPAPGYPAQPDHTEKPILFDLLDATRATGVTLTENHAMHPGAAVCGLYFSHPDSHYFALSHLQQDQVEDYASRKGMTVAEAEKWLGPWLGYIP